MRSAEKPWQLGWGGRVAIGHVTKLSALEPARFTAMAKRLADAGVAVTVLPATDLFLMGRDHDHDIPRGVTPAHRLLDSGVACSIASNNILNPFTPFGDCSLLRMANLYANIAQIGGPAELASCLDMVTMLPAKLMNLQDYGDHGRQPGRFHRAGLQRSHGRCRRNRAAAVRYEEWPPNICLPAAAIAARCERRALTRRLFLEAGRTRLVVLGDGLFKQGQSRSQ